MSAKSGRGKSQMYRATPPPPIYDETGMPHYPGARIDGRDQSDPYVQAGARDIHRGMDGNVIGMVDPRTGIRYGTKAGTALKGHGSRAANYQQPILPTDENSTAAAPAGTALLAARKKLQQDMARAGVEGITPEMQARATNLGVTPGGWQHAVNGIQMAPATTGRTAPAPTAGVGNSGANPYTPAPYALDPVTAAYKAQADKTLNPIYRQAPQPNNTPYPQPTTPLTPQITTKTGPGPAPIVNGQRINRLTGKPMGWRPGDPDPTVPKQATPATPPAPYKAPPIPLNTATTPVAGPPAIPGALPATTARKPSWQDSTAPVQTGALNSPFKGSLLDANAAAADASQKRNAAQAAGLMGGTIKPPPTAPILLTPNPSTPDNKPDAAAQVQAAKPPPTPAAVKPDATAAYTPMSPAPDSLPSWKTAVQPPAPPQSSMSPADAKGITSPDQTIKKSVETGFESADEWMKKQKNKGPAFGQGPTAKSVQVKPGNPIQLPRWLAPDDSMAQKLMNSLGS